MSGEAASTTTLAALRQARAHQRATWRVLRLLGPVAVVLAIVTAFRTDPRPALQGTGLAIALALTACAVSAVSALVIRNGPPRLRVAVVAVLFVSSLTLVWLQPHGVGFFGLFVAVVLVARRIPDRAGIALTGVGLVFLVLTATVGTHQPSVSGLLRGAVLVAFYVVAVLAQRLGAANLQAESLLVELEASRDAQARAAALAERQRLAREMHDVLAHSLSGLMLQLEGARILAAEAPTDPRLPDAIERAHQLGRTGLDEARHAIGMLRDEDLPGPELLAMLASDFARDSGIPCDVVVTGSERDLDPQARLAVYRVAQEALTNVVKHAVAQRVQVCFGYEEDLARLVVEDFGADAGDLARPGTPRGYGLTGMSERAELLGGSLTATPTGSGFRVQLEVPV